MHCPKCKNIELIDGKLDDNLAAKHCPNCQGNWIRGYEYQEWQKHQSQEPVSPQILAQNLHTKFTHSPLDVKAGLCPECHRYLSRAKVMLQSSFFVERCPECQGIWCDDGEWDILSQLELHRTIEQLFSNEWQTQAREQQHIQKERQELINKFGTEIANQIFELGELLQSHSEGDFGVAYLMRKVSEKSQSNNNYKSNNLKFSMQNK